MGCYSQIYIQGVGFRNKFACNFLLLLSDKRIVITTNSSIEKDEYLQ